MTNSRSNSPIPLGIKDNSKKKNMNGGEIDIKYLFKYLSNMSSLDNKREDLSEFTDDICDKKGKEEITTKSSDEEIEFWITIGRDFLNFGVDMEGNLIPLYHTKSHAYKKGGKSMWKSTTTGLYSIIEFWISLIEDLAKAKNGNKSYCQYRWNKKQCTVENKMNRVRKIFHLKDDMNEEDFNYQILNLIVRLVSGQDDEEKLPIMVQDLIGIDISAYRKKGVKIDFWTYEYYEEDEIPSDCEFKPYEDLAKLLN